MRIDETFVCLSLVVLCGSAPALGSAQSNPGTSPYRGFDSRRIKALSTEEIEGYESGKGMGLALAAELNGYPGPKHVLELEQALELSPEQRQQVARVFDEMRADAVSIGTDIIEREAELDRLFAAHTIDAEALELRTGEIGALEGRLRAVHLAAHLEMMEILRPEQIRRYIELRGYQGSGHGDHSPGDHSHIQR